MVSVCLLIKIQIQLVHFLIHSLILALLSLEFGFQFTNQIGLLVHLYLMFLAGSR